MFLEKSFAKKVKSSDRRNENKPCLLSEKEGIFKISILLKSVFRFNVIS